MPNTNNNGGLSLEALLAAARGVQEEAIDEQTPAEVAPAAEELAAPAAEIAPGAEKSSAIEKPAASAATASSGSAQAAPQSTEAVEPAAEPSVAVQEEALEKAEESKEEAAPAFDLAAALGYGPRDSEPAAAKEPEEKFDLAAALGYKSQEVREREAAEEAAAKAAAQVQAVQDQAYREAERQARFDAVAHEDRTVARVRDAEKPRTRDAERPQAHEAEKPQVRNVESLQSSDVERPQVRSRSFEPAKTTSPSPEERYAAKKEAVRAIVAPDGSTIESYQPTKRDRSAQARAARPLKKAEVSEIAQAIASDQARVEYVEETVERTEATEATITESATKTEPAEGAAAGKEQTPVATKVASEKPAAEAAVKKESVEKPSADESAVEKATAEASFTAKREEQAAPLGEPTPAPKEPAPSESAPVIAADVPAVSQSQAPVQSKPIEPIPVGQPLPVISPAAPAKPMTKPHKVPVRTTEEIIKPMQAPVRLGVISPEAARHEAAEKKKVQSAERKIVKKVRRFRTLGMFLIVLALAALAGAVFLFVAGNASANESIEAEATRICEQAGRTITYRYKAADSNGTLCPTTEVATFSAGDVLEQSVITMNTPDFETAGHTLASFKKQFEKSSYVDGRVDGNTVIFTLHMSSERIMKVTYTALLMKNTTGCEVII